MADQVLHFQAKIAENADDGREQDDTTWNAKGNASSVITFGNVSGAVYDGAFRFRDVGIPKDAKIVLARLKLRPAFTDGSDPDVKLRIRGIKEADTKPFSQSSRPSQRDKTVNSTVWHIVKGWEVHEWVQTPNLALLIEEIVAQAEWKAGNALALIAEDDGSGADEAETCYDSSKGEGYEAELEVFFIPDTDAIVSVGTLAGNDRDGVEEDKTNWFSSPAGNILTLGHDGATSNDCGLIFSGMSIPKESRILSAKILFTQADQNNKFPNLLIKGFAEDNAPPFQSDGSNRPSIREKTKAETDWNIGETVTGVHVGLHWSAESVYETPELREIVQEIVDREEWTEGNRLGFVLEDWESWSGQYKLPWDYVKNSGEFAAKLVIVWKRIRRADSDPDTHPFKKANYPEFIIVHHTATARDTTAFQTIKNNHIGIGWGDIGYHHWIAGALDGDGEHIDGRPENEIGAHTDTQKMNYRSIGIVVCGNFDSEEPSEAQLETLQELLDETRKLRGIPKEKVLGHQEAPDATNCPGANLLPYIQHYRATGKLQ